MKSYGFKKNKRDLERGGKGSYVHQSTCAGAALSTNRVVADVVGIMSGGRGMRPSVRRVSVSVRGAM